MGGFFENQGNILAEIDIKSIFFRKNFLSHKVPSVFPQGWDHHSWGYRKLAPRVQIVRKSEKRKKSKKESSDSKSHPMMAVCLYRLLEFPCGAVG